MKAYLRSFACTCFWFGIGLTVAVLVLKPNAVNLGLLAFNSEPQPSVHQHRLTIPSRTFSSNAIVPL